MGRKWELYGPDADRMSFDEAAKHFGYEPSSLRKLIRQGRFPAPRGFGQNEFYTGEDLAAITLLLGRWMPEEDEPGQSEPNPSKAAQTGHKRGQTEQTRDS